MIILSLNFGKEWYGMKRLLWLTLALLFLFSAFPVQAEEAPVEIHTVEDLLAMAQNPTGDYVLMADLDMTGIPWPSPDFSGTFDGNGYAILNLTLTEVGNTQHLCYDGNSISYSASFCGFFASLSGATVKNLSLWNVRSVLEGDCPLFLGGIAGYMENSTLSGCTITGCLELRAHDRMFGLGGIVGYGWGSISDCTADVTLICVDTDADTLDEQFLGGAYGAGFISVDRCHITLDGYISEHGFVHSGGVVGMYMAYPFGVSQQARIQDTRVCGKITFFEDNTNRRAYCRALIGETLYSYGKLEGNTTDFIRDERYEYTKELRPEKCDVPDYEESVIPSGCDSYGYTLYTCLLCGYSYRDQYTLPCHNLSYTQTLPATEESEGLLTGICQDCGITFTQAIPRLEPSPTAESTAESTTGREETLPEPTETEKPRPQEGATWIFPTAAGAAVLVVAGILLLRPGKRHGKFQK